MWWSGLIVKREVKDGNYNIETIDIKTIRENMEDDNYVFEVHIYLYK